MILTKKELDTKWSEMFRYCRESEAAKADVLLLFSEEPNAKHKWSEQDIYEQIRKIVQKYE